MPGISRGDLLVGPGRLLEGQVLGQGDDAVQDRVVGLEPLEAELGEVEGPDLSFPDERGEVRHRQEGQVFVGPGRRDLDLRRPQGRFPGRERRPGRTGLKTRAEGVSLPRPISRRA